MRTVTLALILAIPVSLVADLIGMALTEADASVAPCATPVAAPLRELPPKAQNSLPVRRPAERFIRTS